jgi:hypothetical protein
VDRLLARLTGEPEPEPEPDPEIAAMAAKVAAASLPPGRIPAGPRGQAVPADWVRAGLRLAGLRAGRR